MFGKFFDPFSKSAREATEDSTSVFICKVANQIPDIINNIQEKVKEVEEQYIH